MDSLLWEQESRYGSMVLVIAVPDWGLNAREKGASD